MAISLSWLKSDNKFNKIIEKITIDSALDNEELDYILACAIIFIREYCTHKKNKRYFELGYYILLKYGVKYNDHTPLLDISANFGLFPITSFILSRSLYRDKDLPLELDYKIDKFKHNEIIETIEQNKCRNLLLESKSNDNSFVAPTSYGKSSLIVDIVRSRPLHKIAVIVPTKSLLIQTYRLLSKNITDRKIIFHDEMYSDEKYFVGVLTQERALRLMKNQDISFDTLIIDEAHNLFESDTRSILLSRLIGKNKRRNPKSQNYYFSPLISNSDNLKIEDGQNVIEHRIAHNIKEPEIYEYRLTGDAYKYNRFSDEFYKIDSNESYLQYIHKNKKDKNFFYLRAPRKVEILARELSSSIQGISDNQLDMLSDVISDNVHKDFYCVEFIKNGVVYLHGKLPDLIKEYLEHKFKDVKSIKFVIANKVILEGVNLPIDNLFVLNTHELHEKDLINLIGRVNRLDAVFSKTQNTLEKLLPTVHFVNTVEYSRTNSKMENKIRALKSGDFKDKVGNPTLTNFNIKSFKDSNREGTSDGNNPNSKVDRIISREKYLIENDNNIDEKLRISFIESGLEAIYSAPSSAFSTIISKISSLREIEDWSDIDTIDKLYFVLIEDLENIIKNKEFGRLSRESARKFYKMFVNDKHVLSLKEQISKTIKHFHDIQNSDAGRMFYMGESYGEIPKIREDGTPGKLVYINLANKSPKEIANLALVKIKIESDFVSFRLNEYVKFLFEAHLINEQEYNQFIYGVFDKPSSKLGRLGLSGSLLNKLKRDKQLENIHINELGRIQSTDEFKRYISKQDDLIQFEISKYF